MRAAKEPLAEANQWLLLGRLTIAVISIVMVLVAGGAPPDTAYWAQWVYTGAFAYLVLDLVYLFATGYVRAYEQFLFLQAVGDLAIATTLLYFTGGIFSHFFFLYFAVLLAAGSILRARVALAFCVVAAVFLGLVVLLHSFDIGMSPGVFYRFYRPSELVANYIGRVAALWGVGGLTVLLNRRLHVARLLSAQILDSIGEAVLVCDGGGYVVYESSEFRAMSGASGNGRHYAAIPPFCDVPALRVLTEQLADEPLKLSLPHAGASQKRPFLVYARAVADEPWRGFIVRFVDLSTRERLEAAERRAERYRVIAETARSIGHEIRNPLASLNVALQELFRGYEAPAERRELLAVAQSEVRRLDRVLEAFLDFSRPRPPERRLIAARGIAEETASIILRHQSERPVDVRVEGPADLTLRADPDMLRQALINLGLNAVQAEANRIIIRLLPDKAAGRVCIEVEDDGSGMTEETRRRIFEPFFSTRTTGTGLGLPIVHRIVEEHGGSIAVESQPGRGSIFRLYLPRDEDEETRMKDEGRRQPGRPRG